MAARLSRKLSLREGGDEDQGLAIATSFSRPEVFACTTELGWLCMYDLREEGGRPAASHRLSADAQEVTSLCMHPKDDNLAYASLGREVIELDLRRLDDTAIATASNVVCTAPEEVNQVVLSATGEYLACADDSGEVQVVKAKERSVFKRLRKVHTSICSCVSFRPRQPWDIISGGLDCTINVWDFSRGRVKTSLESSTGLDPGDGAESSQVFNPPMIHALAVPETRELANHVAAARGDASVAVYDLAKVAKTKEKRALVLKSLRKGHTTSVGHLCFTKFSGDRQILSGGNDGNLVMWNWLEGSIGDPSKPALIPWSLKHGKKINWTATTGSASENVLVADTSSALSVYSCLL